MAFNTFGGLVVVPAFIKVLRPGFFAKRLARRAFLHEQAAAAS